MKVCGGGEQKFHAFLTSALDKDEWSASRSGRSISGNELPVRTL
jgi:hypothetical protein